LNQNKFGWIFSKIALCILVTTLFINTISYLDTDDQKEDGQKISKTYGESGVPINNSDKFGVSMLYPSEKDGEEWYINMSDPSSDKRFHSIQPKQNIISRNPDGSWKLTSVDSTSKIRMNVFTSSGYHQDRINTLNHSKLALKGYMQDPKDWKNVEMTGYVKVNSFDSDDKFQWFNRGGIHYNVNSPDSSPCEGVGYKGNLFFSGNTRFAKEQWHVSYNFTTLHHATDSLEGGWVGYKFIVYNVKVDGKLAVKLENWLDKRANGTWIKVDEYLDIGGWGDDGKMCEGKPDQLITWGGPVATFRWDNAPDVDFKYFSVREIQVPRA
jgi:hypothetical protein